MAHDRYEGVVGSVGDWRGTGPQNALRGYDRIRCCIGGIQEARAYTKNTVRGWQATRVQLLTDLGNRNITNHHKCSSRYKDMKFGLNF